MPKHANRRNDWLFDRYRQERNTADRDALLELYRLDSLRIAKRLAGRHKLTLEDEEMEQCGLRGCWRAIEGFRTDKAATFNTYLWHAVGFEILHAKQELQKGGSARSDYWKLDRKRELLEHAAGRKLEDAEAAELLGVKEGVLRTARLALKRSPHFSEFHDRLAKPRREVAYESQIPDREKAVDYTEQREAVAYTRRLIDDCDVKDRTRVMLRQRADGMTQDAIAEHHGVSRERARQILKQAGMRMAELAMVRDYGLVVMPADEYHGRRLEYLTSHQAIKLVQGGPDAFVADRRKPDADSAAYSFGRACHVYCLEGNVEFNNQFEVGGPLNPKTRKEYGATTKAFAEYAALRSKQVCRREDFYVVRKMATRVRANPEAAKLLVGGKPELTLRTELAGIPVQVRADWITTPPFRLVDLKTTREITAITAQFHAYGYGFQQAFYQLALQKAFGEVPPAYIIWAEKVAHPAVEPHRVRVWELPETAADAEAYGSRYVNQNGRGFFCMELAREFLMHTLAKHKGLIMREIEGAKNG